MQQAVTSLISFCKIADPRGNLTVVEQYKEVPFAISRVYWTYDVPTGESRGGHAHKHCREVLVAVSGSFSVTLDRAGERHTFLLNHPYQGLLVDRGVWRTLEDFSSGAVCFVIASDPYDAADYIYEYDDFLKYKGVKR